MQEHRLGGFFDVFFSLCLIRFDVNFVYLINSCIFHRIWKCCTDDNCRESFLHILCNDRYSFNGAFVGEVWRYHDQYQ